MAGRLTRTWASIKRRLAPPTADWTNEPRHVYERERPIISARRKHLKTGQPAIPATWPPINPDTVGLCLSGGGIRSAAFSLGALQALDATKLTPGDPPGGKTALSYVDYLSTVSGGGYIGSAMTARMRGGEGFPFPSVLGKEEPAALRGIRDRSNYLFPPRDRALTKNAAIYLRGLFANVLRVGSSLLLAAGLTLLLRPDLNESRWLAGAFNYMSRVAAPPPHFGWSAILAVILLLYLAIWAIVRSLQDMGLGGEVSDKGEESEVTGPLTKIGALLLTVLAVLFVVELQPILIEFLKCRASAWVRIAGVALTASSGVIAYFRTTIVKLADRVIDSPGWKSVSTRLLFAVLALPVPLLIWLVYLLLSAHGYEGSCDCAELTAKPHLDRWYLGIGGALFVVLTLLSANANSLHRLYRERLNAAFFRSRESVGADAAEAAARADRVAVPKLSQLESRSGPYHLINTSINLQGSRYLNERGRNADVFIFSPQYVGSHATGFVPTGAFEAACPDLDVGTAMAISGAAVSPDMGVSTLRWLAPTLAFLNVRLGYWIRNPQRLHQPPAVRGGRLWRVTKRILWHCGGYFFAEAFGWLNERRPEVYLTDGGHSDDLGLYELLRRRCRLIIVVDGEQDGDLRFPSFVSLQRYARIDHGIRIDVPWQSIRDSSLAASAALAGGGKVEARHGPHCALGVIHYGPEAGDGLLLYVKSSLSGDESDYIMDYALRNAAFPHESTVDQFFTEEQFEVYRALGFHALYSVLSGDDCLSVQPAPSKPAHVDVEPDAPLHRIVDDVPLLKELRAALGLPEPQWPASSGR